MAIFLYQIGIFIAIQIAAMFGRNSRNTAIVLISIFTILQVFMSWLLLLQFITIFISYNISNNLFFKDDEAEKIEKEPSFHMENNNSILSKVEIQQVKETDVKKDNEKIYSEEIKTLNNNDLIIEIGKKFGNKEYRKTIDLVNVLTIRIFSDRLIFDSDFLLDIHLKNVFSYVSLNKIEEAKERINDFFYIAIYHTEKYNNLVKSIFQEIDGNEIIKENEVFEELTISEFKIYLKNISVITDEEFDFSKFDEIEKKYANNFPSKNINEHKLNELVKVKDFFNC